MTNAPETQGDQAKTAISGPLWISLALTALGGLGLLVWTESSAPYLMFGIAILGLGGMLFYCALYLATIVELLRTRLPLPNQPQSAADSTQRSEIKR